MPEHQKWVVEGVFRLKEGKHILRIQSEPLMSHIDKVLIIEAPLPNTDTIMTPTRGGHRATWCRLPPRTNWCRVC